MPCNSDYTSTTPTERKMSKVVALLDELDGKGTPDPSKYGDGYDNRVSGYKPEHEMDALVASLCDRLQQIDVSQYSLEMQIWWRDHKEADIARVAKEIEAQKTEAEKQAALAKLTEHELQLLRITP